MRWGVGSEGEVRGSEALWMTGIILHLLWVVRLVAFNACIREGEA